MTGDSSKPSSPDNFPAELQDQLTRVPVLALRDVVVLPGTEVPLFVGRALSLRALELAVEGGGRLLLVSQREPEHEQIKVNNLYRVGTLSEVKQILRMGDGTVKAQVFSLERSKVDGFEMDDGALYAEISSVEITKLPEEEEQRYASVLRKQFGEYVTKGGRKLPREVKVTGENVSGLSELVDFLALHSSLELTEMQELLELPQLVPRTEFLMKALERRIEMGKLERTLRKRIKKQMEKNQKEYYLNEQIKAAQKELVAESGGDEWEVLRRKVEEAKMSDAASEKALAEISKLEMMSPGSAEAYVIRNYLDVLLSLPWHKSTRIRRDLQQATKMLEEEHYGLDDVKERILEYLAVQSRTRKPQSTVLCLVGPPGVGKTSLGKSIARATGRNFAHIALGGVRDEAEIRGHRRTYVGAMPGRILQRLTKTGTSNPLFLLDEVDKIGRDYHRGDPASALLEVLDPEQNGNFFDHFLDTEYDLSSVMFVCTANTLNIPPALLDRMEVVQVSGYTEEEKLHIAQKHLLPKQLQRAGLKPAELQLTEETINGIIHGYTQEAGVRQLEQRFGRIARKVVLASQRAAKKATKGNKKPAISVQIQIAELTDYLGVKEYHQQESGKVDRIGQITGLAWTSSGGEILTIESVCIPGGRGRTIKTGSLGDVMQESVQAALTVARTCAVGMDVIVGYPEQCDIHLHIPSGATPKDGPSAGLGMTVAVLSSITGLPIAGNLAVTGEITLRGEVLRIGALKEKLLAARRSGIERVLIPEENTADLSEISEHVKKDLEIIPVRWVGEVWQHVFGDALPRDKLKALGSPPLYEKAKYVVKQEPASNSNLHH